MSVESEIKEILKTRKMHITLIDPDEQSPQQAVDIAQAAIRGGTDIILVGGSTVNQNQVDFTCKELKENIDKPVIIFPGNTSSVSKYADAILFMSFINSTNPYWIVGAQALAAPAVKESGIETLPMGYMVCEPGGTVGYVGQAQLVPRNKPKIPAVYAMSSEFMGMRFFYLEAGSGAEKPIPPKMIAYTKKATTDMVLLVGGGIRDGEAAYTAAKAGADMIVTGTIVEETEDVESKISEITQAIKKASQ
jgi:phosphoglycerol geranylgeranyltransferase